MELDAAASSVGSGMHGDEFDEDDDEEDEGEEGGEGVEQFTPFESDDFSVLPCPIRVPHDIKPGDQIAMWFGAPYNEWFIGDITEVHPKRTKNNNVEAMFEGGAGGMIVTAEQYGVDKSWLLVKPAPEEEDLTKEKE